MEIKTQQCSESLYLFLFFFFSRATSFGFFIRNEDRIDHTAENQKFKIEMTKNHGAYSGIINFFSVVLEPKIDDWKKCSFFHLD